MNKPTILHYLRDYALTQPDTPAVCELRKQLTYSEYWSSIRKMASALTEAGIKPADHVLLRCTQNINFTVLFSALQYVHALVIPVEKSTAPERMLEIGKQVDASWVIADQPAGEIAFISEKEIVKAAADLPEMEIELPGENDRSMLLFTTGTTGASKGVMMLHRNDVGISGNVIDGTGMREGNTEIIPMPLNHAFGIRRFQADMVNGGTVCLMDGMVFIGTLWKLMDKYHATSMALSPASLGMIFQLSGERISEYADQLDYIQIGSAPLTEADKERMLQLLPKTRLYNFYGSSEAGCSCILQFDSDDNRPGCIGRPTVNSLLRFTDENGKEVEHADIDHPALLSWGGSIVMEGYYKAPELTAKTIVDGYVKTNDMGYLDEDGRCMLVGRADDVINYGGSKISPAEVEDCASTFEGIADCVCTSIPDAITGEMPVLLIVKGENYDEAALTAFLTERLENYKMPRRFFYVEELPKTFKGSIIRKEAKRIALEESEKEENA